MSKPGAALDHDPVLAAFENAPLDNEMLIDEEKAELGGRIAKAQAEGWQGTSSEEVLARLRARHEP